MISNLTTLHDKADSHPFGVPKSPVAIGLFSTMAGTNKHSETF